MSATRTRSFSEVLASIEAAINDPARQVEARCARPGCGATWFYPAALVVEPSRLCERCEAEDRHRRETDRAPILLAAGVPELFLQPFVQPSPWPGGGEMAAKLQSWRGSPWCVVLAGVVEGGKTMLGTELMYRAALARGRDALWVRAGAVPRMCFDRETGVKAFDRLVSVSVLMLDDLGRGHDGKAWNVLVEIISERHQHQRATVITTNRKLTRGSRPQDQAGPPGLFDEDAAAGRRMAEGLVVAINRPWGSER